MKTLYPINNNTIVCPLTGNRITITVQHMNSMMTKYPDFVTCLLNNLNTGEKDINKVFKQTFVDFVTLHPERKNKFLPYIITIYILCVFRCHGFNSKSPLSYRTLGQDGFLAPGAYDNAPLHFGAFLWVMRNESDPMDMKSVWYVHNCMVILNRLDNYKFIDDRLDQDIIWPRFYALPLWDINWLFKWSMDLLRELLDTHQIVMNPEPLYGY